MMHEFVLHAAAAGALFGSCLPAQAAIHTIQQPQTAARPAPFRAIFGKDLGADLHDLSCQLGAMPAPKGLSHHGGLDSVTDFAVTNPTRRRALLTQANHSTRPES